jgi:hypothetical protein
LGRSRDLVVTLGRDGRVVNKAKYLSSQPLLRPSGHVTLTPRRSPPFAGIMNAKQGSGAPF